MSRYDSRTTIFSDEGRLYQVEYARECINMSGTMVGILTNEGIVIAASNMVKSPLLSDSFLPEKIHAIDDRILCGFGGTTSDANVLIKKARKIANEYREKYDVPIDVEKLSKEICDLKQRYTQYGGLRPFGVSFMFASESANKEFKLYVTDPAGNYVVWKSKVIGMNSSVGQTLLQKHYKNDLDLEAAKLLAISILKTIVVGTLKNDQTEIAVVYREQGQCVHRRLDQNECNALVTQATTLS